MAPTEVGPIFTQSHYNIDGLAAVVIQYALDNGWQDADAAALVGHYLDYTNADDHPLPSGWQSMGYDPYDWSSALQDAAFEATNSAEEYLNDNVAEDGHWFGSLPEADAWGYWEIETDDDYMEYRYEQVYRILWAQGIRR